MTETDICNLALARIGEPRIASIDDEGRLPGICKLHYSFTRDVLLRKHRWNFASKRPVALVVAAGVSDVEFSAVYPIPADCLRVMELFAADGSALGETVEDYEIGEGRIFCDLPDGAFLRYVKKVTVVDTMDALFQEALVLALAAEIARTIKPELTGSLLQSAEIALSQAMRIDANESRRRLKGNRYVLRGEI